MNEWDEFRELAVLFGQDSSICPICARGVLTIPSDTAQKRQFCQSCLMRTFGGADDTRTNVSEFMKRLAESGEAPNDNRHTEVSMMKPKAPEPVEPGDDRPTSAPLSDYELRTRSVARFELLGYARAMNWPTVEWRDADGGVCRISAGEWSWRAVPLEAPSKRRLVYVALQELQTRIDHSHVSRGEKDHDGF
jgi:hypothetical protein